MNRGVSVAIALLWIGYVNIAAAQELRIFAEEGGTTAGEGEAVGFVTMDRADGRSRFDLSSTLTFFDEVESDFNNRLDFYGAAMASQRLGVYGTLSTSVVTAGDISEGGVGNLELGVTFLAWQSRETTSILRAGWALPTASEREGAFVNGATGWGRLTDVVAVTPETSWLRLSLSQLWRQGALFARGDAGIDIGFGADVSVDPLLRFNVGVGVATRNVAITGEFVSIGTTGEPAEETGRFLHTFAVSASRSRGKVKPFAAAVVPVDAAAGVQLALVAGVRLGH